MRIGITGGIGSGKSYVCRQLCAAGFPVFNCDEEARRVIGSDPAVRQALAQLVGPQLYGADGALCKPLLADYLRSGSACAARVNAIVHPRVRDIYKEWAEAAEAAAQPARAVTFVESALLFEAELDRLVDKVAVVCAPAEVRLRRVMSRDGATRRQVRAWMALQMDEAEKRRRADILIPNAGTAPPDLSPLLALIRN